jgi:hypothetical protein
MDDSREHEVIGLGVKSLKDSGKTAGYGGDRDTDDMIWEVINAGKPYAEVR